MFAVIVPSCVRAHLDALLPDIERESDLVEVFIVDNNPDSGEVPTGHELRTTVLSPGSNLGWAGGVNLGWEHARQRGGFSAYLLLNDDVRLSRGFFAGLAEALTDDIGVLAPCYDDVWIHQRAKHSGPAMLFEPEPVEKQVPFIDGTAMLVSARASEVVGMLDTETFGVTGWGADFDYCLRAKEHGFAIAVTRRAFLNHYRSSTGYSLYDAYERLGRADLEAGMTRKYGREWRALLSIAPTNPIVGRRK